MTTSSAQHSNNHVQVDFSLNVATTLADLMGAVPVDISLENRVQVPGLEKLGDGRTTTIDFQGSITTGVAGKK